MYQKDTIPKAIQKNRYGKKRNIPINNLKNVNVPKKSNQRFLNSWEHDNIYEEDDIKEDIQQEFSHRKMEDNGKNTPREEGSAVIRLLESMSKFEDHDKEVIHHDSSDEDDDFEGLQQIELFRKAQQNSRLAF
eukprot:CAMPEP_0205806142 /NCGR_PEP_ID=MMETSP0205-20121125/9571_1 /ASSEMBLY_ACC=CAM_ASM_000278 /TAXON_ID=36767 /ORGANISM="Euplotes focardii, Strain TN1" /LENGTH=132 /DNA_ID=CAMNT_0053078475 /DNA_START=297 /DNA_END=692 /DNA_ORIENTATION=+